MPVTSLQFKEKRERAVTTTKSVKENSRETRKEAEISVSERPTN